MPDAVRTVPTWEMRRRLRERPAGRPAMYQTWSDLLFAHWRVEPEHVQRTLPKGLYVDTLDGAAYVGIVPFFMRNIRPRGLPALPGISNFLELNVRTYVHDEAGTPGVWFYSLDCNQPLAVWTARTLFHLPYRHARMSAERSGNAIAYASTVRGTSLRCELTYALQHETAEARPESLEFFLVERYLLYSAAGDGRLFTGQVHHRPYPVAAAEIVGAGAPLPWACNLLAEHDFGIDPARPDHVCGSPGVDVEVFGLRRHVL